MLEKTLESPLDSKETFEKTLMLGKIEGGRRRGQQRMSWLDGITDLMAMSLSKLWEMAGQGRLAYCSPRDQRRMRLSN